MVYKCTLESISEPTWPPGYGGFPHSTFISCLLATQEWTINASCLTENSVCMCVNMYM